MSLRRGPADRWARNPTPDPAEPLCGALPHAGWGWGGWGGQRLLPPTTTFLDPRHDSPEHLRETIWPEVQLSLQNRGTSKTRGRDPLEAEHHPRAWRKGRVTGGSHIAPPKSPGPLTMVPRTAALVWMCRVSYKSRILNEGAAAPPRGSKLTRSVGSEQAQGDWTLTHTPSWAHSISLQGPSRPYTCTSCSPLSPPFPQHKSVPFGPRLSSLSSLIPCPQQPSA